MPDRSTFHGIAWFMWAIGAAFIVSLVSNPLYTAMVLAIACTAMHFHARSPSARRAFRALVLFGATIATFRVALAALTTHGIGTAWVTLPTLTLPTLLGGFAVGGTVEAPVVLQSLNEGLTIVTIMAVFGAANACAAHHEVLERIPRALHEFGLVISIGLAYVPATIDALHDVRLADRARTGGGRARRRGLRRLIIPVLATGLERALALSESMDARGFAGGPPTRGDRRAALEATSGVALLAATIVALVARRPAFALLAATGAATAIGFAIISTSRSTERTRYRPRAFSPADRCMVVGVGLASIALIALRVLGTPDLAWAASPGEWPAVGLAPLFALGLLLTPLLPVRWAPPTSARSRITETVA